ncbi:MAG: hypothetical protein Q9160_006337 [Pyrenula sp. 1 TL-2023]
MVGKTPVAIHDDERSSLERPPDSNEQDSFQSLIKAINDTLGPSSGIDSDDVDANEIQEIMARYNSQEDEWSQYALFDPSRPYTRNLVNEGNGNSNLLVLVWGPDRQSPVHDHANAHCIMKILKGSLVETMYETPVAQDVASDKGEKATLPLKCKGSKTHNENEVAYINDKVWQFIKTKNDRDSEQTS